MAKFVKDNFIVLLVSMLVGLLCWLSEKAIENSVRLSSIEKKVDRITTEILIIKDGYGERRQQE